MTSAATGAAVAQTPPAGEAIDTIVVSGSRIVRDGMTASTPVSVMGADRLEQRASTNIGDCSMNCRLSARPIHQPNVASGLPANNILPNIRPSTISDTGVINAPAQLRGISFNADATPRPFVYGSQVNTLFMIGGENKNNQGYFPLPIRAPTEQYTLYTRTNYDFTDALTGRLDVSFGRVEGESAARQLLNTGYTIQRGNPFIPTSTNPALDINSIMAANNLQSFTLGRHFNEYGAPPVESTNEAFRAVAALNGELADGWTWDAYYQYGRNDFISTTSGLGITACVTNALNAVRNTAGQIVCAINADAVATNDDPGCAPLNPFGSQASAPAADYVLGTSIQTNLMTQHVMAGNLQGEVFETWAGPVSVAGGLGYRSDEIEGEADPVSNALGFATNNASLIGGEIEVTEGYQETIVGSQRNDVEDRHSTAAC